MIKRKYRNQYEGKPLKTEENNLFLLSKDQKVSFPRIIRAISEPKLNLNSETRSKLIREIYTPLKECGSTKSLHKLDSSITKISVYTSNNRSTLNSRKRQISAHDQVRMINNSTSQDKQIKKSPELRGLQKLVDYNIYKNHPPISRQQYYEQFRPVNDPTNPSILKVKNMKSSPSSNQNKQNKINAQPFYQIEPKKIKPVEINGSQFIFSNKEDQDLNSLKVANSPQQYFKSQNSSPSRKQQNGYETVEIRHSRNTNGNKVNNPSSNRSIKVSDKVNKISIVPYIPSGQLSVQNSLKM